MLDLQKIHEFAFTGSGCCNCLDISPCNRFLVAASHDKHVHCWDLSTGKRVWRMKEHEGPCYQATFSQDGKSIASCGAGKTDGQCIVWATSTGKVKSRFAVRAASEIFHIAISPDQTQIAFGFREDTGDLLSGWNVHTFDGKTLLFQSEPTEYPPDNLIFSANSKTLHVFSEGSLESRSTSTWKRKMQHERDGEVIASLTTNRPVRLFAADRVQKFVIEIDPKTGQVNNTYLKKLGKHSKNIRAVAFSKNRITAAYQSGYIAIEDIKSGDVASATLPELEGHEDKSFALSRDGKLLAEDSGKTIRVWRVSHES